MPLVDARLINATNKAIETITADLEKNRQTCLSIPTKKWAVIKIISHILLKVAIKSKERILCGMNPHFMFTRKRKANGGKLLEKATKTMPR